MIRQIKHSGTQQVTLNKEKEVEWSSALCQTQQKTFSKIDHSGALQVRQVDRTGCKGLDPTMNLRQLRPLPEVKSTEVSSGEKASCIRLFQHHQPNRQVGASANGLLMPTFL